MCFKHKYVERGGRAPCVQYAMCLINHQNEVHVLTQMNLCREQTPGSPGETDQQNDSKNWKTQHLRPRIQVHTQCKQIQMLSSTPTTQKKKREKKIACQSLRKCSFIWHFNKWNTALQIHLTLLKQLLKFVPSGHVCSVPQEACRLKQ